MFLTSILSVRNQGDIQNTYLTKIDEIKLNLSLNSIPLYWTAYKSSNLKTNIDLNNLKQRKTLSYNYKNFSEDFVENIIGDMIFKILPICFLEGFKELNNIVSKRILPKNPKYIFTSNLYDTNEDFKLWTAKNVELGTKYIIGQHGSNFGTHRYINPSAEETIADKFITWGWTDNLKQHVPAFIFKITKFTQKINYSDGGLLLILTHVPHRYRLYDVIYENRNYFDNQILFVNKLKSSITKKLTIRKTPSGSALSLGEDVKFNQFHKSVKFDEGEIKIEKLINKSKIVVFTYDSTGMLECLAKNIPTIVFWDNTFDYIRDSAKPYYQMLIDSGILHSSPESASNKINQVWDNIDEWWLSNKTQIFRKKFCEKYATFSDSPINQLKEILLN
jgi:putative transferase (TIGR04331 family)